MCAITICTMYYVMSTFDREFNASVALLGSISAILWFFTTSKRLLHNVCTLYVYSSSNLIVIVFRSHK